MYGSRKITNKTAKVLEQYNKQTSYKTVGNINYYITKKNG